MPLTCFPAGQGHFLSGAHGRGRGEHHSVPTPDDSGRRQARLEQPPRSPECHEEAGAPAVGSRPDTAGAPSAAPAPPDPGHLSSRPDRDGMTESVRRPRPDCPDATRSHASVGCRAGLGRARINIPPPRPIGRPVAARRRSQARQLLLDGPWVRAGRGAPDWDAVARSARIHGHGRIGGIQPGQEMSR